MYHTVHIIPRRCIIAYYYHNSFPNPCPTSFQSSQLEEAFCHHTKKSNDLSPTHHLLDTKGGPRGQSGSSPNRLTVAYRRTEVDAPKDSAQAVFVNSILDAGVRAGIQKITAGSGPRVHSEGHTVRLQDRLQPMTKRPCAIVVQKERHVRLVLVAQQSDGRAHARYSSPWATELPLELTPKFS